MNREERSRELNEMKHRLIHKLRVRLLVEDGRVTVSAVLNSVTFSSVKVYIDGQEVADLCLYENGRLCIFTPATTPPRPGFVVMSILQVRELRDAHMI